MEETIEEDEINQRSEEEIKLFSKINENFEKPIYEGEINTSGIQNHVKEREEILNEPKLYSENIISIMIPVIIAMLIVICAVQKLSPVLESTEIYQSEY